MAKVKVVPRSLTEAYKKREGDFSPNLVGLQLTDGVSLFTLGNFQITTNLDRKLNKNFALGGQWSEYYDLGNLDLTEHESELLMSNDIYIKLNFNPNNISRYVYFGSFHEYIRVTIEQIIQKWKGSLYITPLVTNTPANTVLSFSHNSGQGTSEFLIPTSIIKNPYELIYEGNSDFNDLEASDIFNLSRDYSKYVIYNNGLSYPVIGYTGSSTDYQYIRVSVKGNPFPSLTGSTFGQFTYHLKPNDTEVELFFLGLNDMENILLNRLTTPKYTSSFSSPQEADGFIYFTDKKFTWPTTDGYNLDNNTREYALYLENILEAATDFDNFKTDLVARRFVSESILEYDTDGGGDEVYGRKVHKLLRIYGREFDQVKKYIDGISFANVVTYNKLDNTSDELIKIIAKNLGFDVLLTLGTDNFNLIEQNKPSFSTVFSGYSRNLTSKELDIELWRRLVINAWWLFRSKGTRKVLEFFFKLFNISECVISLDEYVYVAENRLNVDEITQQISKILELTGGNLDDETLSQYPFDEYGFPKVLPNTPENYFQKGGFWYNGGSESTEGNNPHFGEYDLGISYFNQFECFISNFNDLLTGSTTVTVDKNYFNNYNKGTFIYDQNGLPVPFYGTGYANTLNSGLVQNARVLSAGLTYVGGSNAPKTNKPNGDKFSMKISFTPGTKEFCETCRYEFLYGTDGVVYIKGTNPRQPVVEEKCCQNYWLGSGDVDPVFSCPPVMLSSPDGALGPCVVLSQSDGNTVSQACCNKGSLGFDVYWDGTKCLDTNCAKINGLGTGDAGGLGTEDIGGTVFNSTELFAGTPLPIKGSFGCYWCPPDSYITKVCTVSEYLTTLTTTQIDQLAVSYGWNGVGNASTYLVSYLTPFFQTYGCLFLDSDKKPINNQSCCTLKGGTWTLDAGSKKYYCVEPPVTSTCSGILNNSSHVYVNGDGTLATQECCTSLGYQWSNGLISMFNETTGQSEPQFQDAVGVSFANGLGSNSFCTSCPTQLKTSGVYEAAGTVLVIRDNSNNNITQKCCEDYGFNWDLLNNRCLRCATNVITNLTTSTSGNYTVITDTNGNNLSETCCLNLQGPNYEYNWYGYGNPTPTDSLPRTAKCYNCPPLTYTSDANSVSVINNTNYQIVNDEVWYNGSPLISPVCCTNYAIYTSYGGPLQFQFDSFTGKCKKIN